jgi:hypothetical protein
MDDGSVEWMVRCHWIPLRGRLTECQLDLSYQLPFLDGYTQARPRDVSLTRRTMRWPEQVEAGDLTEASCGPVRHVGWVRDVGGRIC